MRGIVLAHAVDFDGWRSAARALALEGVAPEEVVWSVEEATDLFAKQGESAPLAGAFTVSRGLVQLAETASRRATPSVSRCSTP